MFKLLNKLTSSPYFPNQDAIAGGLAGLAAFYVARLLHLDADTAMQLVLAAAVLVNHFTPLSVKDLAKEADVIIKDKGGAVTDLMLRVSKTDAERVVVDAKEPAQPASETSPQ